MAVVPSQVIMNWLASKLDPSLKSMVLYLIPAQENLKSAVQEMEKNKNKVLAPVSTNLTDALRKINYAVTVLAFGLEKP